jgi:hypothetical protein
MQRVLAFEGTPALSVPLRFLLTAPWFGVAAGLLLAWFGADALQNRWASGTLALTHLMTLGFLAMTMAGALLQLLPVAAGFEVPQVQRVAMLAWVGLGAGTLLLVAGFLTGAGMLFAAAAVVLGLALLGFLGAVGVALLRRASPSALATVAGMRFACAALAIAIVPALAVSAWLSGGPAVPVLLLADLHAAWALLGWVGILVIAVAFQVIVMFEATAIYPRLLALSLPAALFALLVGWSVAVWTGAGWAHWAAVGVALAFALFSGASLYLLARRKARATAATTMYWRLSLGCLLLCALLYAWPAPDSSARPLLLGILFIVGFAASAVNGMLYRIVPFLLWYHLAQSGVPRSAAPGVNAWIATGHAKAQFCCHAAALAGLTLAVMLPSLARPAGLLFAADMAWLGMMLARAALRYRRALATSGRKGA